MAIKREDLKRHTCLLMTFDEFKALVEEVTDGLKTVECEFGAYVTDSDKACELEQYDKRDILVLLSEYLGVEVTSYHSDECDYMGVWLCYEEKKHKYLLNVTFCAGSDDPEDTDRDVFLLETDEKISESEMKEIFRKVNYLLDPYEDRDFPISYIDGLNVNTLIKGVGIYLKTIVKEVYSNMGPVEADDYYVIEQWQ